MAVVSHTDEEHVDRQLDFVETLLHGIQRIDCSILVGFQPDQCGSRRMPPQQVVTNQFLITLSTLSGYPTLIDEHDINGCPRK